MKILMVYPRYPNTFWTFRESLKFVKKKASFPPLGLLTVASMLPEDWEIKLVDLNINSLKNKDVLWADLVFISAMIIQKESVEDVIKVCNKLGKKIVAGGPLFTTMHDEFEGIDHFILDEAEITLPPFLEDLKNNTLQHIYTSEEKPDISTTPIPKWSLINLNDYSSILVQFSRGCPFNCEFCDIIIMNGRKPRLKTIDQMIAEIQILYDLGYRHSIFIVDDNFIGNKVEVKKLLAAIIKWQISHDYPVTFYTEASVNLAKDEELLQLMSDANFNKVFLGIETPSVDSLKECGKHQNMTLDLVEAMNTIHKYGLQIMGGFIVGFDNDKDDIFDRQIDFIQKTGINVAMVGILQALPKTQLYDRLKRENRLIKNSNGDNTDAVLSYKPKMGKKTLINGYKKLLANIYSPKQYYRRIDTFLKKFRPTAKASLKMDTSVKPFFRSLGKIGLFSSARWFFWKMLFKTLFTRIKSFPIAIELAILGEHFTEITNTIVTNQY